MSKGYLSNFSHSIKTHALAHPQMARPLPRLCLLPGMPSPTTVPPSELTCRFLWSRMREIWIFFLPIVPGWAEQSLSRGEGKEDGVGGWRAEPGTAPRPPLATSPGCGRCLMNTFRNIPHEKAEQGKRPPSFGDLLPQHVKNDLLVIVVPWGA